MFIGNIDKKDSSVGRSTLYICPSCFVDKDPLPVLVKSINSFPVDNTPTYLYVFQLQDKAKQVQIFKGVIQWLFQWYRKTDSFCVE